MIKTYIFDFDGTIADTQKLVLTLLGQISAKYKYNLLSNESISILRTKGSMALITSLNIEPKHVTEIMTTLVNEVTKNIVDVKLFPGIQQVLLELKNRNITLGILTSNSIKNTQIFLDKNDVNLFDFVISEKDLFGKDIMLKKILTENNLISDETAYIGDEDRDIQAAKKAGLKSIAVTWGYNSEELLQSNKPNYLIKSPIELLSIYAND